MLLLVDLLLLLLLLLLLVVGVRVVTIRMGPLIAQVRRIRT